MAITVETTEDFGPHAKLRVLKLDGVDLASVAANTSAAQDLTVPGLLATDIAIQFTLSAAQAGIGIVGIRVKAANTLEVTMMNTTADAVNASALNDCYLTILRG